MGTKKLKKALKFVDEHPPMLDRDHQKELKKLGFKASKKQKGENVKMLDRVDLKFQIVDPEEKKEPIYIKSRRK